MLLWIYLGWLLDDMDGDRLTLNDHDLGFIFSFNSWKQTSWWWCSYLVRKEGFISWWDLIIYLHFFWWSSGGGSLGGEIISPFVISCIKFCQTIVQRNLSYAVVFVKIHTSEVGIAKVGIGQYYNQAMDNFLIQFTLISSQWYHSLISIWLIAIPLKSMIGLR